MKKPVSAAKRASLRAASIKWKKNNAERNRVLTATWKANNRPRLRAYTKKWQAANPDKVRAHSKNARLKKFGLDINQYNMLLDAQQGKCAICQKENQAKRDWCIDHCHKTGKVRALLCTRCNCALGLLLEDTNIMQQMIKYTNYHHEKENDLAATETHHR